MTEQVKTKLSIKPLGNRVVAQKLEEVTEIKGKIIIPDSAKKEQSRAKVLAVGPGKKTKNGELIPIEVSIGDVILMDKYSSQEVTLDDVVYLVIKADDIMAIIKE